MTKWGCFYFPTQFCKPIKTTNTMTPLNTGVALLIYISFCLIFTSGVSNRKTKEFLELSGGACIVALFIDLIWAAFYYINL